MGYLVFYLEENGKKLCLRAFRFLCCPAGVLVGEPVEDAFFELTKPELNFDGDEAVDIGHVAGGKNDS